MAISTTVEDSTNTVTIIVDIPLPINLIGIKLAFPPKLPELPTLLIPEALKAVAALLKQLQAIINKLLKLIPQAAIHLIIKLGSLTIFDQVLTAADAVAIAASQTLCKK